MSACDTQGIDAATHATVGNGFIALGARTVIGTFLPVDGLWSAMFITRLMHRLAEFVPAAIKSLKRAVPWSEVVSGMLRMCLVTEILMALVGLPGSGGYDEIQTDINLAINHGDPTWFDQLIDLVARFREVDARMAEALIQKIIARSDAVRYTQLGNPETIVLSDDSVVDHFMTRREQDASNEGNATNEET